MSTLEKEIAYYPALRASMGDWWYYVVTLTFKDIKERVSKVNDIHEATSLKTWIQREQDDTRLQKIADYLLTQPQHFFNALVVGIYGGSPDWLPVSVSKGSTHPEAVLNERISTAFGFICLSGDEELFAIDGQHRVEGIKKALSGENGKEIENEEQTVILVAHKKDHEGRERTRRLFSTLNRYAKPVSLGELIALSEDDTFALVTRKLIDEYQGLSGDFVPLYKTSNLPPSDKKSLTSVISLYGSVKALCIPFGKRASGKLLAGPPDATQVESFYQIAVEFWDSVNACFPEVKKTVTSNPNLNVASNYRSEKGGHFLFRPFCLLPFCKAVRILKDRGKSIEQAVKILSKAEMEISEEPWRHVIWNPSKGVMINKNEPLVRNLLLHEAKQALAPAKFDLKGEYLEALGEAETTYEVE